MRIYKTKLFARFARKQEIEDTALCEAVVRAQKGLIDADLGGGLIKQRVARKGEGRSGGYRTIIAYRAQDRAFFMYGFAKNERDNISVEELKSLKEAAAVYLSLNSKTLKGLVTQGRFVEVNFNA